MNLTLKEALLVSTFLGASFLGLQASAQTTGQYYKAGVPGIPNSAEGVEQIGIDSVTQA